MYLDPIILLFRFHSNGAINRSGFKIEYSALELFAECGGNYSNPSGTLISPSHTNLYPHFADCVYFISQPNGTYINISFISMNIACHGSGSDTLEMRDGNSEDSPLMGSFCGMISDVPLFLTTTQNFLWLR